MAPEPMCALCHDAGYLRLDVPVGHVDFGRLVLCACQQETARERRLTELLALSGLSPEMSALTFDTFHAGADPALAAALSAGLGFAGNPAGWLVLTGSFGTGKTHLLAAIADALIRQGRPVYYQYAPKLLAQLRATFREGWSGPSYDELYARIAGADVLLLDDLGAEKGSEWGVEQLTMMLDERYRAQAPTVIGTNLDPQRLGGRIGSRLRDVRLVTLVGMGSRDYRRGGAV